MPSFPATFAEDGINQPARAQFEEFLDKHRSQLNRCLNGLTEEQARQLLVLSRTTLLGRVKHPDQPAVADLLRLDRRWARGRGDC
jgi:hypothetical protein